MCAGAAAAAAFSHPGQYIGSDRTVEKKNNVGSFRTVDLENKLFSMPSDDNPQMQALSPTPFSKNTKKHQMSRRRKNEKFPPKPGSVFPHRLPRAHSTNINSLPAPPFPSLAGRRAVLTTGTGHRSSSPNPSPMAVNRSAGATGSSAGASSAGAGRGWGALALVDYDDEDQFVDDAGGLEDEDLVQPEAHDEPPVRRRRGPQVGSRSEDRWATAVAVATPELLAEWASRNYLAKRSTPDTQVQYCVYNSAVHISYLVRLRCTFFVILFTWFISNAQKLDDVQFYRCRWHADGCSFTGRATGELGGGFSAVLLSAGHDLEKHGKEKSGMDPIYSAFVDSQVSLLGGQGSSIQSIIITEIFKANGFFEQRIQSMIKIAQATHAHGAPAADQSTLRARACAELEANVPSAKDIVNRHVRLHSHVQYVVVCFILFNLLSFSFLDHRRLPHRVRSARRELRLRRPNRLFKASLYSRSKIHSKRMSAWTGRSQSGRPPRLCFSSIRRVDWRRTAHPARSSFLHGSNCVSVT